LVRVNVRMKAATRHNLGVFGRDLTPPTEWDRLIAERGGILPEIRSGRDEGGKWENDWEPIESGTQLMQKSRMSSVTREIKSNQTTPLLSDYSTAAKTLSYAMGESWARKMGEFKGGAQAEKLH